MVFENQAKKTWRWRVMFGSFWFFIVFFALPQSVLAQSGEVGVPSLNQDEFFRGRVIEVLREYPKEEYGDHVFVQFLRVQIKSDPEKGKGVSIPWEMPMDRVQEQKLAPGDQVILGKQFGPTEIIYYISDVYRLNGVLWILLGFCVLTILFSRWQGARAIIGLAVSLAIIVWFIVPQIIEGQDPVLISILGTAAVACSALYIAHGYHSRTHVAFVSTLFTILITIGISYFFVDVIHLFGLGSEEAFYLQFVPGYQIRLRGLLLGGIIIGALGVLDDVTTTQAATVEQIAQASNHTFGFRTLYDRGLSVGREHIVSLVNTLALAYTGAALPLILLFFVYERPLWVTLNSEIVVEELIRMLIGSISLVLAVPVTTLLAAWIFHKPHSYEAK